MAFIASKCVYTTPLDHRISFTFLRVFVKLFFFCFLSNQFLFEKKWGFSPIPCLYFNIHMQIIWFIWCIHCLYCFSSLYRTSWSSFSPPKLTTYECYPISNAYSSFQLDFVKGIFHPRRGEWQHSDSSRYIRRLCILLYRYTNDSWPSV